VVCHVPSQEKRQKKSPQVTYLAKKFHHNQEKPLSDSLPFVVTLKVRAQVAYSAKSKVLSPKLNDVRTSSEVSQTTKRGLSVKFVPSAFR
jgi:hypothetical protein